VTPRRTPGSTPWLATWWARYGNTVRQFVKFGLVGGSGVVVNSLVVIICKKIHPDYERVLVPIIGTDFNIRVYHLYATLAFLVANVWNYQLNRMWTFRSRYHLPWLRGFFPFLGAGTAAFVIALGVQTLLINPTSPLALPRTVFDDSTGLRTLLYWANLIGTLVATPMNFVLNKLWVFASVRARSVRARRRAEEQDPQETPAVPGRRGER